MNDDVKARLVEDVSTAVNELAGGKAAGIIVSGDIAYSGKKKQYKEAGAWLDKIAGAAGCAITDIQVVPGNHDVDLDEISHAGNWMLGEIKVHGEDKLDEFLANARDREMFYDRFGAYRPFAEAYDSPLDKAGGGAGERKLELAPRRHLRFVGLNTALICSKKDGKGQLLLGARQRVLPRNDGEELVVIAHHPLDWLQDSADARRYVRSRARVFISGHEHSPSVNVETVSQDCDLMMLAAGATIPPTEEPYTYTYNILEFDWDSGTDALIVAVHPRTWSQESKKFEADVKPLNGKGPRFVLGCPNFKRAQPPAADPRPQPSAGRTEPLSNDGTAEQQKQVVEHVSRGDNGTLSAEYPILLLRFFRDLTPGERLAVLVNLGVLPKDWPEPLTHAIERKILDGLERQGRLPQLEAAIDGLRK